MIAHIRLILQSEATECGLACLAMVAQAHGSYHDLSDLRRRFSVSLKGATLAALMRHAQSLGYSTRPLRLDLEHLPQLKLPAILHWDLNHFVLLSEVRKDRVVILDPAVGERRLDLAEFSAHFTGVALELAPTGQFRAVDERAKVRFSDLTGQLSGLRRALFQAFLLAMALEVFALVAPLFNQYVIDEVVLSADRELLSVLAVGFALLLLTQTAIGALRSVLLMHLSIEVGLHWNDSLFARLMRLSPAWFEKRHLGDIVSRFGSLRAMQATLTTAAVSAMLDGLMAVLVLAVMLAYSVTLTAIAAGAVVLYGLLRWAFYRPFREASHERLILSARENSHFLESLRAIVPVKLAGFEAVRRARWQNLLVDVANRDTRTQSLGILFSTLAGFTSAAAALLFFTLGARQVMDSTLTLGMLMAFTSYAATFSSRMTALIGFGIDVKMLGLHAERVADIALEPEEETPTVETDLTRISPRIELREVSFRYAEGEPWVLKNISLCVEAQESVAIIGPSGCGKTTLLKIILGLVMPTTGEVLIDGVPIRRIGLAAYRSLIGAVLQEDTLLAGSIAENVSFFDLHLQQEKVETCTKLAALHDEICAMPMGYQTLVGDMGSSLSGGQKQRLLLARALYRQPKILVLDEATSHLDIFNEQRIVKALGELSLTRIIVAHRPETIAGAGRVIALNGVSPAPTGGVRASVS